MNRISILDNNTSKNDDTLIVFVDNSCTLTSPSTAILCSFILSYFKYIIVQQYIFVNSKVLNKKKRTERDRERV